MKKDIIFIYFNGPSSPSSEQHHILIFLNYFVSMENVLKHGFIDFVCNKYRQNVQICSSYVNNVTKYYHYINW